MYIYTHKYIYIYIFIYMYRYIYVCVYAVQRAMLARLLSPFSLARIYLGFRV